MRDPEFSFERGGPLRAWLDAHGCNADSAVALPGDVSPRRYFRLPRAGTSSILACYPAESGDALERFLASSALLERAGVRVPRVEAWAPEHGAMLLEDFGALTLYDLAADWAKRAPHFLRAIEVLGRVRSISPAPVAALNPPLGPELLARELAKTRDVFLLPGGLLEAGERAAWDEFARQLTAALASGAPAAPAHRDFMARNLVALPGGELGVLDHQDLRLAPPAYDVASLLNDSLFAPPALEARALELADMTSPAARAAYRRAAVQRGLKAVGTFAAFAARGAPRYVPLIAPTGSRALSHLALLPERALLPEGLRRRLARAFCYTD